MVWEVWENVNVPSNNACGSFHIVQGMLLCIIESFESALKWLLDCFPQCPNIDTA